MISCTRGPPEGTTSPGNQSQEQHGHSQPPELAPALPSPQARKASVVRIPSNQPCCCRWGWRGACLLMHSRSSKLCHLWTKITDLPLLLINFNAKIVSNKYKISNNHQQMMVSHCGMHSWYRRLHRSDIFLWSFTRKHVSATMAIKLNSSSMDPLVKWLWFLAAGVLIREAKFLISMNFVHIDMVHAPWFCNSCAHELARVSLSWDLDQSYVWIWSPPRVCNFLGNSELKWTYENAIKWLLCFKKIDLVSFPPIIHALVVSASALCAHRATQCWWPGGYRWPHTVTPFFANMHCKGRRVCHFTWTLSLHANANLQESQWDPNIQCLLFHNKNSLAAGKTETRGLWRPASQGLFIHSFHTKCSTSQ